MSLSRFVGITKINLDNSEKCGLFYLNLDNSEKCGLFYLNYPLFPNVEVTWGHLSFCKANYPKVPSLVVICKIACDLERKK